MIVSREDFFFSDKRKTVLLQIMEEKKYKYIYFRQEITHDDAAGVDVEFFVHK